MKYCSKCLQPDTRPNSQFTEEGICPACNYFYKLSEVDWEYRYEILKKIIKRHKPKSSKTKFDCIIGVSGGKDSTRQALFLRDNLGLRPLLICLGHPPEMVTERGVDNISQLIELGFDVLVSNLAPVTWKDLMRESFLKFCNHGKSPELALFSSVPRLAIDYGINLIFWGENPGLQLGDLKTLGSSGYDGNNLKNMNTLSGGDISWIKNLGYENKDIIGYLYPKEEEFSNAGLQIIYLGWFLGDWSLINNAMYSCTYGLKIREDTVKNTGDLYGITSLDDDWVTLNQMIKYYKFGFGRVTDYVNEEIRLKRMTRDFGITLVEKYDNSCSDHYINSFCDYIQITREEFNKKLYENVNRNLFHVEKNGSIIKKFKVGSGL